jgi:hypothetical protein
MRPLKHAVRAFDAAKRTVEMKTTKHGMRRYELRDPALDVPNMADGTPALPLPLAAGIPALLCA